MYSHQLESELALSGLNEVEFDFRQVQIRLFFGSFDREDRQVGILRDRDQAALKTTSFSRKNEVLQIITLL